MKELKQERAFKELSAEAREELHFVEAWFGPPTCQDGSLKFTVRNFCITEDNPINQTGHPLWIEEGTIECLGVMCSERVIVPHIRRGDKLEFGPKETISDLPPSTGESTPTPPTIVTFELEGRMEKPQAGVLSWVIKCSAVSLTILK